MTVEYAAAFENSLAGNRDKGEQADVYLGLKKPFEKVHHRRLKRNASSHQIRRKDTIDIVGLINLKKPHWIAIKGHLENQNVLRMLWWDKISQGQKITLC